MKGLWLCIASACFAILLSGCAETTTLKAPCPDFGAHCDKTPINSWNTNV